MDSQTTASTPLDVYQLVTDQIISLLEKGVVPWQKPWKEGGIPMNLLSKRPYRGINLWLLNSLPYEHNCFLTWEQIKSVGGSVLKGQVGQMVVFWKSVKMKPEELDERGNPKKVPMLRYYKLFNIEQCRDIPEHLLPVPEKSFFDPIQQCEAILNEIPDMPAIHLKGKQALYNIEKDEIWLPQLKNFKTPESYYSTLYHELIHATGAAKRLNRKTLVDRVPFGTESYSMEELIAEMGSAYLCQFSGILPNEIKNTVAYLDNWLGVFKNDKRFLISASGSAQKAVDFLLNRQEAETKEEVEETVEESVVS